MSSAPALCRARSGSFGEGSGKVQGRPRSGSFGEVDVGWRARFSRQVIVSDNFVVPGSATRGAVAWSRAVLRHPASRVETLPARLAAVTDEQVAALRAGGAAARSWMDHTASYERGGLEGRGKWRSAAALIWKDLTRLALPPPPPSAASSPPPPPLVSPALSAAISERQTLALTVCPAGAEPSAAAGCAQSWLSALRASGYAGPAAVGHLDASSPGGADGQASPSLGPQAWLLPPLDRAAPRYVAVGTHSFGERALGGEMRGLLGVAAVYGAHLRPQPSLYLPCTFPVPSLYLP